MEYIIGIALSIAVSAGKRLGLEKKNTIQGLILIVAVAYSVLKFYSVNLDFEKYFNDIITISATAIAFYEVISKRLNGIIKL